MTLLGPFQFWIFCDSMILLIYHVISMVLFPNAKSCSLSWLNIIHKKLQKQNFPALLTGQTIPNKSHKCCFHFEAGTGNLLVFISFFFVV